jgi:hypothetical protein
MSAKSMRTIFKRKSGMMKLRIDADKDLGGL